MQISMKDTLSELRKKKKVTQEAVAAHLGITSQSVGKWERGEGFPDITLLPALALYFGVTVDDLLGVGKARQKERINTLLDGAERELLENGPAAAVEACREAYREFPNDLRIMARFILYIFFNEAKEHEEDARLAVSLGERVLSESVDHAQRTGVIHTLAMLWHELGDDEQAKKYASMLGSYYTTSGQALGLVLRGEECREQRCRNIIEVTGLLANTILYLPSLGGEMPDKDIVCAEKTLALFDLIYEDGDYGIDVSTVYEAHFRLAEAYGRMRDAERCLAELSIAADWAFRTEQETGQEIRYTSRLVRGIVYPSGSTNRYPAVEIMRNEMEEFGGFQFLREDERFREIQNRLLPNPASSGTGEA